MARMWPPRRRGGGDAAADKRQEAAADEAAQDKRHKRPKSVTESLKEKSTQTGEQAMNAVPGSHPAEPANAEAVYTTGPGQAVEYNYTRQGTYADQYAEQSNQQVAVEGNPVAGVGGGAGPGYMFGGMANNPT